MPVPHLRAFAARVELIQRILANRFQHPEARLGISRDFLPHQTLVQE